MKPRLLIFSNLYPLPWEPQRGMFNFQQFSRLTENFEVRVVVPVSFIDWYANKNITALPDNNYSGPERWLFPYFFTPKIFRGLYPWMMTMSLHFQLFDRIKQFAPDYVLGSWLYPDGIVAAAIAGRLAIPYVLKAHGSDINVYLDHSARGKAILAACNGARKVIVVSNALKEILLLRGMTPPQIEVLYNGIDAARFYSADIFASRSDLSRLRKLLFVGNLKRDKGVMELLQAFLALDNRVDCQLTIVGDGSMRREMENLVRIQDQTANIHFAGSLPHAALPDLMRAADLLVLPSYREGVPNVILEAMACGLPVVATSVGGIPEIVEPDITGLLVPEKNVDALKQAIQKALVHPWDSGAIAQRSQRFNWDQNIQRLTHSIRGHDVA